MTFLLHPVVMMFPFLRFPRELRDLVYRQYVTIEGGYLCDTDAFTNGRLKGIDGQPIDLALVFTCKTIADEMDSGGLALRLNPITFTTLDSPELGSLANVFHALMTTGVDSLRAAMLNSVGHSLTEKAVTELKATYPQFAPLLDLFKAERPPPRLGLERRSLMTMHYGTYGETPSIYRAFVRHALRLAASEPGSSLTVGDFLRPAVRECDTTGMSSANFAVVNCRLEPWDIPSESEMEALVSMTAHADVLLGQAETPRTKHRFSAAAAAIYFLRFLSHDLRRQIRRIILLEDTSSVCHPESHAGGLIPFCQDNPMLHVERRVALWTNVFTKDVVYDSWRELQWRNFTGEAVPGDLISHQITKNLAPWIMEASALRAAGMPDDSFSILLESGGAPELCTSIFESVVHRDVAWQEAWMKCAEEDGTLSLSWFDRRIQSYVAYQQGVSHVAPISPRLMQALSNHWMFTTLDHGFAGYFFEGLPQAVRDIVEGRSTVSCDFDVGTPLDHEPIFDLHKAWNERKWALEWPSHSPAIWRTVSPLPDWAVIVRDNIIRPEEDHLDDAAYYT
ncbi:hypothetical protein K4K52_005646 [Colletotrichum sp. SAR 10_76]|nr:hypothetical protein K4K52_005646 [Colletotrichum sp. SAR 10_76]